MSTARIYVPEGVLTVDQRRVIAKGINDVINTVEKRPPNAQTSTYVVFNEVAATDWAHDGLLSGR